MNIAAKRSDSQRGTDAQCSKLFLLWLSVCMRSTAEGRAQARTLDEWGLAAVETSGESQFGPPLGVCLSPSLFAIEDVS